jgi:hypothetical protein
LRPEYVIGRSPQLRHLLDQWHAVIDRTLGLLAIDDMLFGPGDQNEPAHPGYSSRHAALLDLDWKEVFPSSISRAVK